MTRASHTQRTRRGAAAAVLVGSTLLLLARASWADAAPRAARPDVIGVGLDLQPFVREAAERFGVPRRWIEAVAHQESGFRRFAVSPKGALGLMQIMPSTWSDLRRDFGLGPDPFDPHDNLIAGAAYLRRLHDQFGDPGFLAAYNAGPARYLDHLLRGRPLPAETRRYVAAVGAEIAGRTAPVGLEPALPTLFAPIMGGAIDRHPNVDPTPPDRARTNAPGGESALFAGAWRAPE